MSESSFKDDALFLFFKAVLPLENQLTRMENRQIRFKMKPESVLKTQASCCHSLSGSGSSLS